MRRPDIYDPKYNYRGERVDNEKVDKYRDPMESKNSISNLYAIAWNTIREDSEFFSKCY